MTELVDLRDGAKELHLSIHTLRSWTYHKRIPYVRLGRRILLRREDMENLIKKSLVLPKE